MFCAESFLSGGEAGVDGIRTYTDGLNHIGQHFYCSADGMHFRREMSINDEKVPLTHA